MQTATVEVQNLEKSGKQTIRLLLDTGSQRSYITEELADNNVPIVATIRLLRSLDKTQFIFWNNRSNSTMEKKQKQKQSIIQGISRRSTRQVL